MAEDKKLGIFFEKVNNLKRVHVQQCTIMHHKQNSAKRVDLELAVLITANLYLKEALVNLNLDYGERWQ